MIKMLVYLCISYITIIILNKFNLSGYLTFILYGIVFMIESIIIETISRKINLNIMRKKKANKK